MQLNHITQKSLFWEQVNTLAKEAFPPKEYLAPDELVKIAARATAAVQMKP